MKKIIAITCENDFHTKSVEKKLLDLDVQLLSLEREGYGKKWVFSSLNGTKESEVYLDTMEGSYTQKEVGAIWNRRDFYISEESEESTPDMHYINIQKSIHVNGILKYLDTTIPMMNSVQANWVANTKLYQAEVAKKNGFLIPETFQGGSPEIANHFLESNKKYEICIKPLEAIHIKYPSKEKFAHLTSLFRPRPKEELHSLRDCPVILQNFIKKDYEIRATVVGQKVFAVSIDTKNASSEAKIDWRHYDWKNTPYYSINLPKDIEDKLIRVSSELGLFYGAYDLIKTINDDYYFLEVNPQGQWLWIEELTGLEISKEIANWLYKSSKNGN